MPMCAGAGRPTPPRHGRAPTCVDRHSGLTDDHLRGHRRVRPQPVQPLGHLQELGGQVEPVQGPVAQEHDGSGGGTVPGQDGGLQGHLEDGEGHSEPGRGGGGRPAAEPREEARPAQPGPDAVSSLPLPLCLRAPGLAPSRCPSPPCWVTPRWRLGKRRVGTRAERPPPPVTASGGHGLLAAPYVVCLTNETAVGGALPGPAVPVAERARCRDSG